MPTNKMTGQRGNTRGSKTQKIGGQKRSNTLQGGRGNSKSGGTGRKSSSRTSQ